MLLLLRTVAAALLAQMPVADFLDNPGARAAVLEAFGYNNKVDFVEEQLYLLRSYPWRKQAWGTTVPQTTPLEGNRQNTYENQQTNLNLTTCLHRLVRPRMVIFREGL